MSGLDKMISQILDEANQLAERKLADANARAVIMKLKAKTEADAQGKRIFDKAQADVERNAHRMESSCEMQRKQAILRAKQDVIASVLDKAYDRILNLETDAYFDMIRKMLEVFVLPEKGEIYFSAESLRKMPAGFEEEIEKTAVQKGGTLTLSKETKEMKGGFILAYGGIEENCTIKALFDAKRDELSDKVNNVIFN